MIKAVIDTNVLVSALWTKNTESPTYRILIALLQGNFIALYNNEILDEYSEVLSRSKFKFAPEMVRDVIDLIRATGLETFPINSTDEFPDPDDRVFYEVALAEPETHLVTGNTKHYPSSAIVVTPARFCELLGI